MKTSIVKLIRELQRYPGDWDLDLTVVVRNPASPGGKEAVPVRGVEVMQTGRGMATLALLTDLTKEPKA